MNRIMLALAALAAAAPATAADRRLTVTEFDRVRVEGPFEVVLTTGKSPSAMLSGSPQALERVTVDVQGSVLRVRTNNSAWGGYPGAAAAPPRIKLSTHDLRGAQLIGSGSLSIDQAEAMRFDISLSGSGRISIGELEADTLVVGLVGSGTADIGGSAKSLKATVQGSGTLNGQNLATDDAEINAATSGRVDVRVRRAARIDSTGAGETIVSGGAACTVNRIGAGPVLCDKYSDQAQR